MLGRSAKCSFCGSRENLTRCSCGKFYCPVHGFGGRCTECYSKSLLRAPGTETLPAVRSRAEPERPRKEERGPITIRTRIGFAGTDAGETSADLTKILRNHHFLCYLQRRVAALEAGSEIEVLYHGDRIMNTLNLEGLQLEVLTKPNQGTANALKGLEGSVENLGKRLPRIPPAARYEAYKAMVHHNEISWLTQASLISRGTEIQEARMDLHLKEIPVRAYGPLCPFCGSSVVVEGSKCRFCSREVPEETAADGFMITHLKRQFTDKLIGLRMLSREGEISPEQYRSTRERYLALRESLPRVKWSG